MPAARRLQRISGDLRSRQQRLRHLIGRSPFGQDVIRVFFYICGCSDV
jgi:hypothetical protein